MEWIKFIWYNTANGANGMDSGVIRREKKGENHDKYHVNTSNIMEEIIHHAVNQQARKQQPDQTLVMSRPY
eukprot:scaffold855_cov274-Chaetoceros_neogracile.AAC.9